MEALNLNTVLERRITGLTSRCIRLEDKLNALIAQMNEIEDELGDARTELMEAKEIERRMDDDEATKDDLQQIDWWADA